jgi:hypothetical protein
MSHTTGVFLVSDVLARLTDLPVRSATVISVYSKGKQSRNRRMRSIRGRETSAAV